ncbi:MAG: outer membrane beta-barrel protein [Prevotellaceae bacterium]|jgi:hypothetical protein|nr:outer membrane beta-barrel protein [Prevotellaceae bacterium]
MKKYIVTALLCLLFCSQATAQENRGLSLNAIFDYGELDYGSKQIMSGGGGGIEDTYTGIGIQVTKQVSARWDIVTGFYYSWAEGTGTTEHIPFESWKTTVKVYTVPVLMRVHFWKYFFADGGLYLNALKEMQSATAFPCGVEIGIGTAYTFASGIRVSARPSFRWAMIGTKNNLIQGGVEFGIGYQF